MNWTARILAILSILALNLPLYGGTGRPSDGMLSFLLLLGFLLTILGLLHLADHLKRKLDNLLEGII